MWNKYKKLNLTLKLMVVVSLITSILIILFSTVVLKFTESEIRSTSGNNLQSIAKLKADKIVEKYKTIEEDAKSLNALLSLDSYLCKKKKRSSYTVNTDSLDQILNEIRSFINIKSSLFEGVSFVSPLGQSLYSVDKNGRVYTSFQIPEFEMLLDESKDFDIGMIYEDNLGNYKSFAVIPVKVSQDVVAHIVFHLKVTEVFRWMKDSQGLGETGETLIARKVPGRGALFLHALDGDPKSALKKEALIGSEAAAPILNAVARQTGYGESYDYKNVAVLAAWQPVDYPHVNWGMVAKMNLKEVFEPLEKIKFLIIVVSVVSWLLGMFLCYFYAQFIVKQVVRLKEAVNILSKGNMIRKPIPKDTDDEIGDIISATNELRDYQRAIVEFANNIEKGVFEVKDELKQNDGELTEVLIQMNDELKRVADEELKRSWATKGVAMFGDVLRKNNDNIVELSYDIIFNLVKYFDAIQGGFFLYDDDDDQPMIRLLSSYAFDRRKYKEREIQAGTGLIGQCINEREYIYLSDIPEQYLEVKSGLGDAPPKSLIIVPLKIAEEIHGVVELSSFKLFQEHEIELLQTLAENIASTISSVKVNERTKLLLDETQEMTEAMKSQEEELRQNQEEMLATQEEMDRRIRELEEELAEKNK